MKRKGFTLIELLVVIAIIAILAAILFPVFAQAREKARAITCTSNMKNMGLAFLMYSQDYDEEFPNSYQYHFVNAATGATPLDPYIRNHNANDIHSVFTCPDIAQHYPGPPGGSNGWGAFYISYSMNVFLVSSGADYKVADTDSCYTPAADELTVHYNGSPYMNESNLGYRAYKSPGVTQAAIAAPANTDLLFESYVEQAGSPTGSCATDPYCGNSVKYGDYMSAMGFFPTQVEANTSYGGGYVLQPASTALHGGGVNNYVFCDGHVKAIHPETLGYDITQHPSDNIWLLQDGRSGNPISAPASGGSGGC